MLVHDYAACFWNIMRGPWIGYFKDHFYLLYFYPTCLYWRGLKPRIRYGNTSSIAHPSVSTWDLVVSVLLPYLSYYLCIQILTFWCQLLLLLPSISTSAIGIRYLEPILYFEHLWDWADRKFYQEAGNRYWSSESLLLTTLLTIIDFLGWLLLFPK